MDCFANETEDNSLKILNMITAVNESRSLINVFSVILNVDLM